MSPVCLFLRALFVTSRPSIDITSVPYASNDLSENIAL
jgi:hypothetical protein